jgi:sulfur carrier protein ThiS
MITIEVRFFGAMESFTRRMPAAIQRDLPRVQLAEGATVDDLLRTLQIPTGEERPLVAVNRQFQRDNVVLCDDDHVQLFRTVVGGC